MNFGSGAALVVEYERNDEEHKTLRWSADTEILDILMDIGLVEKVKEIYRMANAEVTRIYKLESLEVCCE